MKNNSYVVIIIYYLNQPNTDTFVVIQTKYFNK